MVEAGPDFWRVRYIRTLREFFHLYVDGNGTLRTDHRVQFLGITVFRMHYKLERIGQARGPGDGAATAGQHGLTTRSS
jgi:hypothetical protein